MLSDEKKRRLYDKYGKEGLNPEAGYQGRQRQHRRQPDEWEEEDVHVHGFPSFAFRDPFDIFREFFGGADPFEEMLDPFADPFGGLMGAPMGMGGQHRHSRNGGGLVIRHSRRQHPMSLSPFGGMGGFGFGLPGFGMGFGGGMFDDMDGGFGGYYWLLQIFQLTNRSLLGGGTSVQTFSSSFGGGMGGMSMSMHGMGGPAGMSVRSSSTSTRIVNGRKVTTKKVVDNGVETVTTYENDVLKSQTVNGVPQAVTNHGQQQARAVRHHQHQQGHQGHHGHQGGRRRHQ